MPNWCENVLEVRGKKEEVEEFVRFVRSGDGDEEEQLFDFNTLLPYPKIFHERDAQVKDFWRRHGFDTRMSIIEGGYKYCMDNNLKVPKDGFNSGGYEWFVDNWGTKWSSSDVIIEINPNTTIYDFITAWAPPIPVIQEAGVRFPNLEFTLDYIEYGMCFKGTFKISNGKIVKDVCEDIPDKEYEKED